VAGVAVDRRLVEAAALLHDVDKALSSDHPVRALGHGAAGAEWLRQAGHPELSRAVIAHPVMRLDDEGAEDWCVSGPIEERIVAYADKRATQRVVSLEQRFARWERRHPEQAERLSRAHERARLLERALCDQVGVEPCAVERLRWVDDAMARARAAGAFDGLEVDGSSPVDTQAADLVGMRAPGDPTTPA
jgi:putative nucleotidyltransferase with HDIG domain